MPQSKPTETRRPVYHDPYGDAVDEYQTTIRLWKSDAKPTLWDQAEANKGGDLIWIPKGEGHANEPPDEDTAA